MTKEELNVHLSSLIGEENVEAWWENPSKYFDYNPPSLIYTHSEDGKKAVENYIMSYCYGKENRT